MATRYPRRMELDSAPRLMGWSSSLTMSRTKLPCTSAVWIQSIQGRLRVVSMGPVPPSTSTGALSHHAL